MEQNDLQIKFNKSTWALISNILFAKSFSFITTELSDVQVQPQVLPDGLWVVILHRTFHIPVQYSTTAQRSCRKGLEKAKPTLAHRPPRTYATQFVDEDTNGFAIPQWSQKRWPQKACLSMQHVPRNPTLIRSLLRNPLACRTVQRGSFWPWIPHKDTEDVEVSVPYWESYTHILFRNDRRTACQHVK